MGMEELKKNRVRIFLAGDSTVADCPDYEAPMAGWGQVLQFFFKEEIEVCNKAMGGRSSNSFIKEGRLASILANINKGDYLFIQFGHNDQKSYGTKPFTSYQYYLEQYITGARKAGAIPVLITSVHRRSFGVDGKLLNTLGEYPAAMTELAERLAVPLIPLWTKTRELYEALGDQQSKQLFVWFEPNESANYPQGIQDNTHFCKYGALEIAKLVIEGIRENELPLEAYIKRTLNGLEGGKE